MLPKSRYEYKIVGARIDKVGVNAAGKKDITQLDYEENFDIEVQYTGIEDIHNICCACTISDKNGKKVCGQRDPEARKEIGYDLKKGEEWISRFRFKGNLWPGRYFVTAGLFIEENEIQQFKHRIIDAITFEIISDEETVQVGLTSMANGRPEKRML